MEQNNGTLRTDDDTSGMLRTAWDFVENTGRSIFLTGKAGTGKTTFLKEVMAGSRKRPIVVAPTGVAAINAGGVTIHSFFQLPFSPYVPGAKVENKFDFSREKRKIIASIDLLIIDEISMVRADLLDAIDAVLRRFREHDQPFGGVQLLMIGDLAQLTPVVTPEDERILKPYYSTPYFFASKALQQIDYVTIQLEHVYRQQDASFINILNEVRNGHPSEAVLAKLNSRLSPQPLPAREGSGYIRLTTHNNIANNYNESELRKLSTPAYTYRAEIKGTFPEYSYPTAEALVLKEGAQVMFVKNDPSGDHRYYNGRIGRVMEAGDNRLTVYCEGDSEAIEVEPLEWENTRYTLNEKTREIEAEVQGTFRQLPLRLAWAITIHKSQGLTFDHAIIDANQSFAPGQVYVALSRCRTLEGLLLASPLEARSIINDERVDSYIAQQEYEAERSICQLPLLKQEYERYLLLQLFDFRSVLALQETMVRIFAEFFYHSHASLKQLHDQALMDLRQRVLDVAGKWQQIIQSMPYEGLHEADFQDRVMRSAGYFSDQLREILAKPIELSAKVETQNKQAARRLDNALPDLRQACLSRRYLLEKMAEMGFSVDNYLHEKQMSMLDALGEDDVKSKRQRKPKASKAPKEVKPKTWEISLQLYQDGMKPDLIAKARSLTLGTVIGHLTRYVESGEVSFDDLVPADHQQAIRRVITKIGVTEGSTAIKNLCPPDITYDEIRLVMQHMQQKKES
ncbi:UvrD-like helicase C-terminal domain-containing protein [Prevotella communis]|uniref:UvrD-like helicase C-terminal domain-containing protein n=1 Tax=Prevotella communis TaxID=2913614 RepID=A0A1G7VPY5_9BACT|nr:helix-turn-helix domain-containing protein [Prevotella communis]SDG61661.1 UvrD-like helicase C-terminal domain-containing protein [Prevotella communis]